MGSIGRYGVGQVKLVFNMTREIVIAPGDPIEGRAVMLSMRGRLYIYCSERWAKSFPRTCKGRFYRNAEGTFEPCDDDEGVQLNYDMERGVFLAPGEKKEGTLDMRTANGAFYIESSEKWARDFSNKYLKPCLWIVCDGWYVIQRTYLA